MAAICARVKYINNEVKNKRNNIKMNEVRMIGYI
jgi:hypothetical protein